MQIDLSILIATQGRRNVKFAVLLKELMRQVRSYGGRIEVIAYWNNAELSIGEIRQALLDEAKGEYVCFIDDDDEIPVYYCDEIMGALGKDYVGFMVKLFDDGIEQRPVYHDLQYQLWAEDEHGYYRGVTHLNPIRRSIALKGNFHSRGASEDAEWASSIIRQGLVQTQNYIDKIMYYYKHSKRDSSFGGDLIEKRRIWRRPKLNYKYFRYHPDSKLIKKEEQYANNIRV